MCCKVRPKNVAKFGREMLQRVAENFGAKFSRENGANLAEKGSDKIVKKFDPKVWQGMQKSNAINFCYELSEQYRLGNSLRNSNL